MCQIPLQEGTYCPKCQLTVSIYQLFHGLPKFLWVFSKTCSSSSPPQLHPYLKTDWADISIHPFLPKTGQLWSICPRALLSRVPGAFQSAAFPLHLKTSQFVCKPFKSRFLVSYNPQALPFIKPNSLQSQFWGFNFKMLIPVTEGHNVEFEPLTF